MKSFMVRAVLVALGACLLSGCIDSSDPILRDAQPVFGEHLDLQLYSLRQGFAHEPEHAVFDWNGGLYVHARGGMRDVSAFTVQSFERGDYIIQSASKRNPSLTEYALLHPLADGVYQVLPIDADDADEQTRSAYCHTVGQSSCRIETRTQLIAFARATAAVHKKDGGLVIRLATGTRRGTNRRR